MQDEACCQARQPSYSTAPGTNVLEANALETTALETNALETKVARIC
jgi:hypothetical protein